MQTIEEKAFDLLDKSGLNWSVTKEPLGSLTSGKPSNSFGIYRENCLGTVGSDYVPLQNSELAIILLNAIEGIENIEWTQGGTLKGGKKVFLQAKLPDEYIGKSEIKRNVSSLNAHDGTQSVGFGSSNTVIICDNTFQRIYKEVEKFRHTTNLKKRIELAQIALNKMLKQEQEMIVNFKKMADLPLTDEAIQATINTLFKIDKDSPLKKASTQKINTLNNFKESIVTSIDEQGPTIWALFNGITRYSNHIAAPSEITKKMDYIMLSGGLTFMNSGYELLKEYTDIHSPKQHFMEINN